MAKRNYFRRAVRRVRSYRRSARAAAPRRRSTGMNADNVVRTVAGLGGLAILLADPINDVISSPDKAGAARAVDRFKNTSPGTYFAAIVPSMTAEAAIAVKKLAKKAPKFFGA